MLLRKLLFKLRSREIVWNLFSFNIQRYKDRLSQVIVMVHFRLLLSLHIKDVR